ncbi:hypothetical protein DOY81_008142 [Sarcophaga bullata]|nr:hypothetical protein DOY81_008142 [Sarcophaga bullata]
MASQKNQEEKFDNSANFAEKKAFTYFNIRGKRNSKIFMEIGSDVLDPGEVEHSNSGDDGTDIGVSGDGVDIVSPADGAAIDEWVTSS